MREKKVEPPRFFLRFVPHGTSPWNCTIIPVFHQLLIIFTVQTIANLDFKGWSFFCRLIPKWICKQPYERWIDFPWLKEQGCIEMPPHVLVMLLLELVAIFVNFNILNMVLDPIKKMTSAFLSALENCGSSCKANNPFFFFFFKCGLARPSILEVSRRIDMLLHSAQLLFSILTQISCNVHDQGALMMVISGPIWKFVFKWETSRACIQYPPSWSNSMVCCSKLKPGGSFPWNKLGQVRSILENRGKEGMQRDFDG